MVLSDGLSAYKRFKMSISNLGSCCNLLMGNCSRLWIERKHWSYLLVSIDSLIRIRPCRHWLLKAISIHCWYLVQLCQCYHNVTYIQNERWLTATWNNIHYWRSQNIYVRIYIKSNVLHCFCLLEVVGVIFNVCKITGIADEVIWTKQACRFLRTCT